MTPQSAAERLLSLDAQLDTLPKDQRQAAYAKQIMERWPLINALLPQREGSDRRRSARAPAPVQLVLACRGVEGTYQAVDISSGGVCIDGAPADWAVGDTVTLREVVEGDVPLADLEAHVSWIVLLKQGSGTTSRAGIEVSGAGSLHVNRMRMLRELAFNRHLSKVATGAEI